MRKIFSVSILLVLAAETAFALLPSAPFAVQCETRGDGCLVIWYYEGVNRCSYLNELGEVDQYFLVTTEDLDNRALARFEGVSSQYPVESISIYLWGQDEFPELPGGPLSLFGLSILGDWPSDSGPDPLWGEDTVAAGLAPPGGQWHDFTIREFLPLPETAFVQFRWFAETPAAPLLVTDGSGDILPNSFFGCRQGGPLTWRPIYAGNLLMRLNYCLPDTLPGLKSDFEQPDSFALYVASDSGAANIMQTPHLVVAESLHVMLPAASISGRYITIAAWHGDQLGPRSAPSRLPGVDTLPFPLTVEPESLFTFMRVGEQIDVQITLSNSSDIDISYRFNLPGNIQWLSIDSCSADLSAGSSDERDFSFNAERTEPGDYRCMVEISCFADGRVFASHHYAICLNVDEPTGVDPTSTGDDQPFSFLRNYPNPFNESTLIMSQSSEALNIFNVLGQQVATLLWHGQTAHGLYIFSWNGADLAGRQLPSGIYFLVANNAGQVRKMLLLR